MAINIFLGVILDFKSTNPIHPERITKAGRVIVNDLDYEGIKFLVSKTDYKD